MKKLTFSLTMLLSLTSAWAAIPLPDYAPLAQGQSVVIAVPQLRLFLFENGKVINSYPIVVGKKKTPTPLGDYKIGPKAYKPTWHIPRSIQKEMKASGKNVITRIPPGPNNPLGPVFVRMGDPKLGLGIHGTNVPGVIPSARSHGCVRLHSKNALEFAKKVNTGTNVAVIYQKAGVNADENKDLWLISYPNFYGKNNLNKSLLIKSMQDWAQKNNLTLHKKRIEKVLSQHRNTLVCVTCATTSSKVNGQLSSLQWTKGLGILVEPQNHPAGTPNTKEPEVTPELPEGTEIEVEVDAGETVPAPQTQLTHQNPSSNAIEIPIEPVQHVNKNS